MGAMHAMADLGASEMPQVLVRVREFADDSRAVTALEYGIIASFFCVGLVTVFSNFGVAVTGLFNTIMVKLH